MIQDHPGGCIDFRGFACRSQSMSAHFAALHLSVCGIVEYAHSTRCADDGFVLSVPSENSR